jgi:hypothetical protein
LCKRPTAEGQPWQRHFCKTWLLVIAKKAKDTANVSHSGWRICGPDTI